MVNIKVSGFPNIYLNSDDENPIGEARTRIRRRIKGGNAGSWKWETRLHRLIIASDTDDFDQTIIGHFQQEGFQISYLEYDGNRANFNSALHHAADNLELGETFAIVAYGDAASLALDVAIRPMPKLAALIAYYPPQMPRTSTGWPQTLPIQIHFASSQKFGTTLPSFKYEDTEEGFAEHDLDEYDKTAATLAWSRTLTVLRRAFGMEDQWDLEAIWDNHTKLEFDTRDASATMKTMVKEPYVNHIPTVKF